MFKLLLKFGWETTKLMATFMDFMLLVGVCLILSVMIDKCSNTQPMPVPNVDQQTTTL